MKEIHRNFHIKAVFIAACLLFLCVACSDPPVADLGDVGPTSSSDVEQVDANDGLYADDADDDPCYGVSCGTNAHCDLGNCVCDPGYEGDPDAECVVPPACQGVTCGTNAHCEQGDCVCNEGYDGDPDVQCVFMSPCDGVSCGTNASCEEGECVCAPGHEGDPDVACGVPPVCEGVSCGTNAHCDEGDCVCDPGHEGDPDVECTYVSPCDGVSCGANAHCDEGDCVCDAGYEGDPDAGCTAVSACEGVTCGANAHCDEGDCVCDAGYEGDPDVECTVPDPCEGVTCGTNAHCDEGDCVCDEGYDGDPDDECFAPPPCDDECAYGATCLNDECVCDPGFYAVTDGCEREVVPDPATRTESEVCEKWNEDPWTLTFDKWAQEPVDECDWGWLSEEYHLEAIRETTRYRWMVGLPAVTSSESAREITQACATTLAAEDTGLTHNITEDFACYTQEAASGAGSSNIAGSSVSAADTVRRYIHDWNTPSLGHRRWNFNPDFGATGFGIRDGYSCQYAFDTSGSADVEYVAYPSAGPFPEEALHGKWSFSTGSLFGDISLSDDTEITIVNLTDNSSITAGDFKYHAGSPGWNMNRPSMVSWRVSEIPDPGETYEITIGDAYGDGEDLVYETTLVQCEN